MVGNSKIKKSKLINKNIIMVLFEHVCSKMLYIYMYFLNQLRKYFNLFFFKMKIIN